MKHHIKKNPKKPLNKFLNALPKKKQLFIFLAVQLFFIILFGYLQFIWQEKNETNTHMVNGQVDVCYPFNISGMPDIILITLDGKDYRLHWHYKGNVEGLGPIDSYNFNELVGQEVTLIVCNGTNRVVDLRSNTTIYYKLEDFNSLAAEMRASVNVSIPIIWFIITAIFGFFLVISYKFS